MSKPKAKSDDGPSPTDLDAPSLRVQIVSDLHLEFYGPPGPRWLSRIPDDIIVPRAPVLALLGDVGLACTDALRSFLHLQSERFELVLFVAGNHEFYNDYGRPAGGTWRPHSVAEQTQWMKDVCAERPNIRFLEKDSLDLCGVRVCGTTLWSFIPVNHLREAEKSLNDYRLSYNHGAGEMPRTLTAYQTTSWFVKNLNWLRGQIKDARERKMPVLVLTHHTPKTLGTSHPRFDGSSMNCCFSTDLTDMLSDPVKVWACGHTHYNFDIECTASGSGQAVRLVSNQRGYPDRPNLDYRPDGVVVEISADSLGGRSGEG
eukprot:CAMPEP_0183290844 /NCGR_PEP_ID=MMETSP0160_2-20130417/432_1 /TAXON_ID=2839 ORGANISM="Odontella Sinensis, Strain Grunow 1884" /NCGR_SAMPLE_ID=MMETSP0160_2 /ASSEMBLY_ACC=CAM_ASM_000250 /LENGTH=315 /DNA_ID=CAMNT_0025451527 /DNA_START=9 /DNA_END=956 /DNA_ORIENTATION=+